MYAATAPFANFFKPELSADFEELFKPMKELAEVNTKTVETLVSLQKAYFEELTNASVEQFKTLCECKDPKAALDLQVKFYKSVEAKMAEAAEKGTATVTEAKNAYVSVIEESSKKVAELAEETAKKITEAKVA